MAKLEKIIKAIKKLIQRYAPQLLSFISSANIMVLFFLVLFHAFKEVAEILILPTLGVTNAINSLLLCYQAYRHGKVLDKKTLRAIASVLTTLGLILAAVFTFIGQAAMTTVAPILLTASLGGKSLYDGVMATIDGYHYFKYRQRDPLLAKQYGKEALLNLFNAVALALAAAGVAGTAFANKASFAILGITAGAMGATYVVIYTGYKLYKMHISHKNEVTVSPVSAEETEKLLPGALSSHAKLYPTLSPLSPASTLPFREHRDSLQSTDHPTQETLQLEEEFTPQPATLTI